ncbi:MAG: hypothetical protein GSR77_05120 [Desulfurococcales archaeon]|nr:hypothetical protein [Desulfurococcales archaeon]
MGAKKALGVLFLLLVLAIATLYTFPQLRERIGILTSNTTVNNNESTNGLGEEAGTVPTETESSNENEASASTTSSTSSPLTTTTSGGSETTGTYGELILEADASEIYYDEFMEKLNVTINITNNGNNAVTINEIRVAGYSTTDILEASPGLPLTLNPGETVSINITTIVNLVTLDIYADYPITILTSQGNLTITSKTVRAPGWMSGYWNDDFLTLLTDKVFLEIGKPVPYEHLFVLSTTQTDYGIATTYKKIYNLTGNILQQVNKTELLNNLQDFLEHNNLSNLAIDESYTNETYLYISATLTEGGYKHAEVTIIYDQNLNKTTIIVMTSEV